MVVAYLSGMRSEECLALRRGCCHPARTDGNTAGGFEIVSKTFKSALDTDGNTILGGVVATTPGMSSDLSTLPYRSWNAYTPTTCSFRTALNNFRGTDTQAPSCAVIARVIEELVVWCNKAAVTQGRPDEVIPADPEGKVTMRRFRRTLAWFIYRLPTGRISLGIQYGHVEGHVTDGYGSRVSAGLRDVFPMEEALSRADRLSDAADRLDEGERVSGPATARYLAGVAEFAHTYRGRFLAPSGYAQLLKNPKLRIYDQRYAAGCLLL